MKKINQTLLTLFMFTLLIYDIRIKYVYISDLILIIYLVINLKHLPEKFNQYFLLIILYTIYSVIVLSANIFFGNNDIIGYMYVIKILLYMLTVVISFLGANDPLFETRLYKIISVLLIGVGIWSYLTGKNHYYGIGTLISNSPNHSAMIYFFVVFTFSFYKERKIDTVLSIIGYILILLTASRSGIIASTIFIFLHNFKNFITKNSIIYLMLLTVLLLVSGKGNFTYFNETRQRFENIPRAANKRYTRSIEQSQEMIGSSPFKVVFGQGKSFPEFFYNKETLSVDNQFVRTIAENGIIGTLLWLLLILSLYKLSHFKSAFIINFIVFMSLTLAYEVFLVSRIATLFWFFTGVTLKGNINE